MISHRRGPILTVDNRDSVVRLCENLGMGLAALEELAGRPVFALSDVEVAAGLAAVAAGAAFLDALRLRLVREADARGLAVAAGATSTAVWLRERDRLSPHTAARWVKLAASVGSATAEALAEGRVNLEQAAVIAQAVGQVPVEHREAGEKLLVDQAATFGPRELARLGERVLEVVDPEGAEAAEAERLAKAERRAYAGRQFNLTTSAPAGPG